MFFFRFRCCDCRVVASQKLQKGRSVNFAQSEGDKLVRLVLENKEIIENKKSDAVTSREKDAAWEALELKFNADASVVRCDAFLFVVVVMHIQLIYFVFKKISFALPKY